MNNLSSELDNSLTTFFKNLAELEETFQAEIKQCRELLEQIDRGDYDANSIKLKLAVYQQMANLYKTSTASSVAIERLRIMANTGKMLTSNEIESVIRQISLVALRYIPPQHHLTFVSELNNISKD